MPVYRPNDYIICSSFHSHEIVLILTNICSSVQFLRSGALAYVCAFRSHVPYFIPDFANVSVPTFFSHRIVRFRVFRSLEHGSHEDPALWYCLTTCAVSAAPFSPVSFSRRCDAWFRWFHCSLFGTALSVSILSSRLLSGLPSSFCDVVAAVMPAELLGSFGATQYDWRCSACLRRTPSCCSETQSRNY